MGKKHLFFKLLPTCPQGSVGGVFGRPASQTSCCWRERSSWGPVDVASVPTPLWPDAGVCGSAQWAVAGTGVEEKMQGAAQSLPTLGTGSRGDLGGGQPLEGGGGTGGTTVGGCGYQPAGAGPSKLHGMFLAVLRTTIKKEDVVGLLFRAARKRIKQDCYPWHQPQLPRQRQQPTQVLELEPLAMGMRFPASHAKLAQGATLVAGG